MKILLMGVMTLLATVFMQTTDAKAALDSDYLTFTALEDNSSISFSYCQGEDVKYCINDGLWNNYSKGSEIELDIGDKVSFIGKNVKTTESYHFNMQGSIAASGSVTSLVDENGSNSTVTLDESQFLYMFYECEALETAPLLPAKTLAKDCYESMFEGCTSLKAAPSLPAEELADQCYCGMFEGCTSLETAPLLPAKVLTRYCYHAMFGNCTSLKEAPLLPAETLEPHCYNRMFYGCTSLMTVPSLPAQTLANNCYQEMYSGCKRLPVSIKKFAEPNESIELVLPDTSEYSKCFENMFFDAGIDNPIVAEDARILATPKPGTYYLGIPVYSINVNSCEHGQILVDSNAKYEDIVEIEVIPDTGYLYRNLTVHNKLTSESVPITDSKFVMPQSDVIVNVEFYPEYTPTPEPSPKPSPEPKFEDPTVTFEDVDKGKWYSKFDGPIAYVVAYKIMSGTGSGKTFEPKSPCTREMFVQILYNLEGEPGAGEANPFKDVKSGKWYYNAVTWALANDVTKGTSADAFGVGGNVTREQLAQFLMNYAKKRGYDITGRADVSKFPDAKEISSWAGNAVSWANANGIINGKIKDGVNVLDPKENATRAEVAQMIMSFTKKFGR